jgi:hypothetical protein
MNMRPLSSPSVKRRSWRRQFGVLTCLVALAVALFGHIETPEASPVNAQETVAILGHVDGAADHDSKAALHHCMHQSQCTFHAVLPSNPLPDDFSVIRKRLAADLSGATRAISPHRRPPKSSSLW